MGSEIEMMEIKMQIKTADGKKSISMSRAEWDRIGKKAGWGDEYKRRIEICRTNAILHNDGVDDDPRLRLQDVVDQMIAEASTSSKYVIEVKQTGEPQVSETTDTIDGDTFPQYSVNLPVEITVYVTVPTDIEMKRKLSSNWLEIVE